MDRSIDRSSYLSIYLSIYQSFDLPIYLSICLSLYLSIHGPIDLSIYLSIYPSINLSLSLSLSICLSIYRSIYLIYSILILFQIKSNPSIYLTTCLSDYLTIWLSICLSIDLSSYLSIAQEATMRDFLQKLKVHSSKTKQFCDTYSNDACCETSSSFDFDTVKNEAVMRAFKNGKLSAELTASCHGVLGFFHLICLNYCACHQKVTPGHTKCCTCHAKSS